MFLQTFWKCVIYNSNFLCNFPVAPGFIIKSGHPEMFWEKPVLINFSKIYQKTPAGKSFLGEVEAYRIFSNERRASNGGSRLWLSGGAWAGLRVGLRSVAGGVVWLWCGMARCGFLGFFLVVVAGCSFLCVWWGGGVGRWAIILWGLDTFLWGLDTSLNIS